VAADRLHGGVVAGVVVLVAVRSVGRNVGATSTSTAFDGDAVGWEST
jgi:hypothetical protein